MPGSQFLHNPPCFLELYQVRTSPKNRRLGFLELVFTSRMPFLSSKQQESTEVKFYTQLICAKTKGVQDRQRAPSHGSLGPTSLDPKRHLDRFTCD